MKLKTTMSVVGLSLKEQESKDGRKFYQMSVDQDGEAGVLPITEDVYNNNKSTFRKYAPYNITCEFNDQYKTCRVIGISSGIASK